MKIQDTRQILHSISGRSLTDQFSLKQLGRSMWRRFTLTIVILRIIISDQTFVKEDVISRPITKAGRTIERRPKLALQATYPPQSFVAPFTKMLMGVFSLHGTVRGTHSTWFYFHLQLLRVTIPVCDLLT